MYQTDQPRIAAHALTPEGFADIGTFVIASINQRFYMVGTILEQLCTVGLEDASYLTATQKRGIAYVRTHAESLLESLSRADGTVAALRRLVEIPCIGIVKGGFLLQLVHGKVGCLDRHNLRTLGLDDRAFARVPQTTEALTQRLHTYIDTCARVGTSAQLWDGWCRLMAVKYPGQFKDAQDVSEKHVVWCRAD